MNIGVHIFGVFGLTLVYLTMKIEGVEVSTAMRCNLMVLSKLPECAVMQSDVNVTELASNVHDRLPPFLNTASLKSMEGIIKASPSSRGLHKQHLVVRYRKVSIVFGIPLA